MDWRRRVHMALDIVSSFNLICEHKLYMDFCHISSQQQIQGLVKVAVNDRATSATFSDRSV